jgi:CheY-like chemotaxis protein
MANAKILLVDDDPDIVDAMKLVLEANGYDVVSAGSAEEGLAMIPQSKPDLAVLDVMMEHDTAGFHMAYQIKNPPAGSELATVCPIPVLMVTGIGKIKGMKFAPESDGDFLPVDSFVEKPIQPAVLLEQISSLLRSPAGE